VHHSPPNVIVLYGPPAVGKTAIGRELAQLSGYTLFHAHQVLDLVTEFFPFGTPAFIRLVRLFTTQFLQEAAASGMSLIVTNGWLFTREIDRAAAIALSEPFLTRGGQAHYIQLWAPLEVRLARNNTPERQAWKKTDWSTDSYLRQLHAIEHRMLPLQPDLSLDTTNLTARESAEAIWSYFQAEPVAEPPPHQRPRTAD
jgi:cytidylate kinase